MVQISTGMMEITRVTSLRSQRGILMRMKPSMTICPVRVPVMVEF